MKDIITNREDMFLAKVAGRDVDITTMTPPVPTNMHEKLMLEVAERIDNASGGGDTYETVAEIAMGTMTEQGGMYIADNVSIDLSGVDAGDALYFNSEEYPLTRIENEGVVIYGYNFRESGISGTPAYGIYVDPTDGTSIVSDTNAIENTTVRILKKVSGGGITVDSTISETSENPVQNKAIYARIAELEAAIEAASNDYKVEISTDGQTITVADGVTVADIVAAAEAGKHVYSVVTISAEGVVFGHQRFELTQWAGTGAMVSVTFGAVQEDDDAAKSVALVGKNTGGDDEWYHV